MTLEGAHKKYIELKAEYDSIVEINKRVRKENYDRFGRTKDPLGTIKMNESDWSYISELLAIRLNKLKEMMNSEDKLTEMINSEAVLYDD